MHDLPFFLRFSCSSVMQHIREGIWRLVRKARLQQDLTWVIINLAPITGAIARGLICHRQGMGIARWASGLRDAMHMRMCRD